jgi:FkbM family methyltransferase
MLKKIKLKIARFIALKIPRAIYEQIQELQQFREEYSQTHYSQEGEEIILRRFFNYKSNGFYVDVGAHHPIRFSNTYLLYKMGWHGINIDATPGSMDSFKKLRKRDINIEAAVLDIQEKLLFYSFNEPALNTFDEQKALTILHKTNYKLISKKIINTQTLAEILEKHLKPNQEIDFFSIDAEGSDLKILQGNNWTKYKPKVIVVESENSDISQLKNDEVTLYLCKIGYKPFAKTFKSVFFAC